MLKSQCGVHWRAGHPLTCCTRIRLLLDNIHAVVLAGRSRRVKVRCLVVRHRCWLHAGVLPQGPRQEGIACGGCTVGPQGCRHHPPVRWSHRDSGGCMPGVMQCTSCGHCTEGVEAGVQAAPVDAQVFRWTHRCSRGSYASARGSSCSAGQSRIRALGLPGQEFVKHW